MATHTVNVPITGDTYINVNSPSTNYGTTQQLVCGGGWPGNTSPDPFTGDIRRMYKQILVKWTPPVIPPRKTVSARLFYYAYDTQLEEQYDYFMLGFDGDPSWQESNVTWNNYTISESAAQFGQARTSAGSYVSVLDDNYNRGRQWLEAGSVRLLGYRNKEIRFGSRESANPPYWVVAYSDVPPSKPTIQGPSGEFLSNQSVIRFRWNYLSSVGGIQKGFNFQWSTNGGSTWTTISQTTANNYYDMPAGTLPAGNISWRVQTINEYDETSPYSDIPVITTIGSASSPVITQVTQGTSQPIIGWISDQQQVYQVQVLRGEDVIYDSGNIPGINTVTHKVAAYLADGSYIAQVRTKNQYDMYSDWGVYPFTVTTDKPRVPSLSAEAHGVGIRLIVTHPAPAGMPVPVGYDVYRRLSGTTEWTRIAASLTFSQWVDYTPASGKPYQYMVRALTDAGAYQDSTVVSATLTLDSGMLASVLDPEISVELKWNLNDRPTKERTRNLQGTPIYYSGRSLPVIELSEHTDSSIVLDFFLTDSDYDLFLTLYNRRETVLYRNGRGVRMFGVLGGLSDREELIGSMAGYTVSATLTEVDYVEEIPFD